MTSQSCWTMVAESSALLSGPCVCVYICIHNICIYKYIQIYIQRHAKVLNKLKIVEFFKYYTIGDCQTWSEYSNITRFFTDKSLMNKKYYFLINSEIFKITLGKSFGHIQFFIDFFVISL